MKNHLASIIVALSVASAPFLRADGWSMRADIGLRLEQIELDVSLKQYEKVISTLADLELESALSIAEESGLPPDQLKDLEERRRHRRAVLMELQDRLRTEISKRASVLEDRRKEAGLTRNELIGTEQRQATPAPAATRPGARVSANPAPTPAKLADAPVPTAPPLTAPPAGPGGLAAPAPGLDPAALPPVAPAGQSAGGSAASDPLGGRR